MNLSIKACIGLFIIVPVSLAQNRTTPNPKNPVTRIRGVIDHSETWSGHVLITDDVQITNGFVTVAPGTTIEFAHTNPDSNPVLTVPAREGGPAALDLQGTPQKPIRFRTLPGTRPGRIVMTLDATHQRYRPKSQQTTVWQHVRFENLGFERRSGAKRKVAIIEPAISVEALGLTIFELRMCSFDGCSRIMLSGVEGAGVRAIGNRFENPTERLNLELAADAGVADGNMPMTVEGNGFSSGLLLRRGTARIDNNFLIGPNAAILIDADVPGTTAVRRNYVHNTTAEDDGHYCINCESADALVSGNIFRGGTSCALAVPRRTSGNVFIGEPKLNSKVVRFTTSHTLVHSLPSGSLFENNLLLGPAHSLLVPQPLLISRSEDTTVDATVIRQNVFDGLGRTPRAIQAGTPGRPPAFLELYNNVFIRTDNIVFSESVSRSTLRYADYNAIAPKPLRPFENIFVGSLEYGATGWGHSDVIGDGPAMLGFAMLLPEKVEDFDRSVRSGELTIAQIREQLFRAYRLRADSPLVGQGRADTGGTDLGPPSIGLPEMKP